MGEDEQRGPDEDAPPQDEGPLTRPHTETKLITDMVAADAAKQIQQAMSSVQHSDSRPPAPGPHQEAVRREEPLVVTVGDLDEREPVPGFKGRFVHSRHVTLAYWDIDEGASLPDHAHQHEQIVNVLEGQFELTVDGKTRRFVPGAVVVIPGNVPHSGRALTPCRILDVFFPVRDDYR